MMMTSRTSAAAAMAAGIVIVIDERRALDITNFEDFGFAYGFQGGGRGRGERWFGGARARGVAGAEGLEGLRDGEEDGAKDCGCDFREAGCG